MFTHTGNVGAGHWLNTRTVKMRQTKTMWITESGEKFRKSTGSLIGGGIWALTKLDLDSIKEITNEEANFRD